MTRPRRLSIAASTLLALLCWASPSAQAQSGPAGRYLKTQHDGLVRVLSRAVRTDRDRERRNQEVTRTLGDLLDYEAVSRRALGRNWDAQSEEAREEFVTLLRGLVEQSYRSNLERTLDYQVRYGDEGSARGVVVVHTTARSRRNRRAPEVAIDYQMRQVGRRWVVVDVVTDGASLVGNYRSQFSRIIRRDGFDGLVRRMRERLASGSRTL